MSAIHHIAYRIATHRGRYTIVVAVYPHYRLSSNIRNSNFQALHRSAHRVPFLVPFHSPPFATVAMVKAISAVAAKLATRTVLFAAGGKGAVVKRPGSDVPVLKRPAAVVVSKRAGLEWVRVVAPAYISGSSMHTLPVLPHHYCIATVYITDHNRRVHVLHPHVVSPVCVYVTVVRNTPSQAVRPLAPSSASPSVIIQLR